jgi:hypothetical protein
MVVTEALGPDQERAVVQRLGLVVAADEVIARAEDVQRGRDIGVVGSERLLAERDELPVAALAVIEERREADRRIDGPGRRIGGRAAAGSACRARTATADICPPVVASTAHYRARHGGPDGEPYVVGRAARHTHPPDPWRRGGCGATAIAPIHSGICDRRPYRPPAPLGYPRHQDGVRAAGRRAWRMDRRTAREVDLLGDGP